MIRTCSACGQKNRIRAANLTDTVRCGRCKTSLGVISEPIAADPETFDEIVSSAKVPVLVDFWADWCGPCHMAAPEVNRVASQMAGKAIVLKVDTDAHPELGARFGVRGIPNFVVLKDGRQVFKKAGVAPATEMVSWIESAAAGQPSR